MILKYAQERKEFYTVFENQVTSYNKLWNHIQNNMVNLALSDIVSAKSLKDFLGGVKEVFKNLVYGEEQSAVNPNFQKNLKLCANQALIEELLRPTVSARFAKKASFQLFSLNSKKGSISDLFKVAGAASR